MDYVGMVLLLFIAFAYGCAPGPPPPPPLLGGPGAMEFGWIILGFIALGIFFVVWKRSCERSSERTDYITKALNDINERLRKLEEEVKHMEEKTDRRY